MNAQEALNRVRHVQSYVMIWIEARGKTPNPIDVPIGHIANHGVSIDSFQRELQRRGLNPTYKFSRGKEDRISF